MHLSLVGMVKWKNYPLVAANCSPAGVSRLGHGAHDRQWANECKPMEEHRPIDNRKEMFLQILYRWLLANARDDVATNLYVPQKLAVCKPTEASWHEDRWQDNTPCFQCTSSGSDGYRAS